MSLMNDIIDRAARNMDVRERLGAATYSGALQALIERVEEYFAAVDALDALVARGTPSGQRQAARKRVIQARGTLRAAVAP